MKHFLSLFLAVMLPMISYGQDPDNQAQIDSIEKSFKYQYGVITLSNGIGKITIPKGFKYLDAAQAETVLVDLWGNPQSENATLGMIFPEEQGVLSETGYAFNIQYDEIGYVKDNDADDIDYDELLKQLQDEAKEANSARAAQGYEAIQIVGWAAKPYYDHERKILHWAKEIKFGDAEVNTLNYNVRILGRKGVLVLNAIAVMPDLATVKKDIPQVLDIVTFNDGYAYKDFDPKIDQVAAWTIGGLVAGKVLSKVGLLAILIKFWKIIALAVAGAFGAMLKFFKKSDDTAV